MAYSSRRGENGADQEVVGAELVALEQLVVGDALADQDDGHPGVLGRGPDVVEHLHAGHRRSGQPRAG